PDLLFLSTPTPTTPPSTLSLHDALPIFYHAGRADDVIISAGWTMSAVEIENTLLKHPDVREAAVIAVPDATRGQVAKAFIVSNRSEEHTSELQSRENLVCRLLLEKKKKK